MRIIFSVLFYTIIFRFCFILFFNRNIHCVYILYSFCFIFALFCSVLFYSVHLLKSKLTLNSLLFWKMRKIEKKKRLGTTRVMQFWEGKKPNVATTTDFYVLFICCLCTIAYFKGRIKANTKFIINFCTFCCCYYYYYICCSCCCCCQCILCCSRCKRFFDATILHLQLYVQPRMLCSCAYYYLNLCSFALARSLCFCCFFSFALDGIYIC